MKHRILVTILEGILALTMLAHLGYYMGTGEFIFAPEWILLLLGIAIGLGEYKKRFTQVQ